jgi:hypothetical protein
VMVLSSTSLSSGVNVITVDRMSNMGTTERKKKKAVLDA